MRLLIVTHYFPEHRGGIEIVAGELARRLAQTGVQIAWAASDTDSMNRAPGAIPMRAWNVAERRLGFPYPLWSPRSLSRLRSLMEWCDVVHLHDSLYMGNALAARLARRLHKPVVITQHIGSVYYRSRILRGLLWLANRTVARRVLTGCDRCVFISPRVRDYFQNFVRFRSPPIYQPNGVDTTRFRPVSEEERCRLRKQFGWTDARPALLFVGRFVEKKGLPALQEAARQLTKCDFVFAGWGPLDPREWNLPNVQYAGSLSGSELALHYQAADLLVLPSVGEGFPLVVQEAAACGTPALISNETAEGHEDIRDFTYVCAPDAPSVVAELQQILNNRSELAKRREWASSFAVATWDWERVTEQYRLMFSELVRASR